MGTTIHNRVYKNPDPRHGCNHPIRIDKRDSGMVAAIQSVSHVTNHNNPQNRSLDSNRRNPGSCAPSRPKQSTSSSMWISELKSNMQEHRLITSQWWKLLIDTRGTTNNDNGPQGTIGTIYGMWISELPSNTHRITRSEANDENLTSNATNLPYAGSKVP